MASHNLFPGYVKIPGEPLYHHDIRVDFNFQVESKPGETRLNSFNLRMFTLPETKDRGKGTEPEIAVKLTAEQWLDLIDSMKQEIDRADDARRTLEDNAE